MVKTFKQMTANLSPGYFALIMATGALSIAANALGFRFIALSLLYFNVAAYLVLSLLTIIRAVRYFQRLASDLVNHTKGPGFFTLVAGTCILGSQLINVVKMPTVALIMWYWGIFLWIIIIYSFFLAVTIRKEKPDLKEGINGAWLIAAVATQSISILGTLLAPQFGTGKTMLLFFSLCMFLLGCMLYLNIIALIFYRFTFIKMESSGFTPPYWINMGAVAIATLAGATLILHSGEWAVLEDMLHFLRGFTLFFWITGTWWIPFLLILMGWRFFYHHLPFQYNAQYWSMVFPLAMYTIGTYKLSQALGIPFLQGISDVFIFIAMAAWLIGIMLLIYHLVTTSRRVKASN